jgi:hypothetical protein
VGARQHADSVNREDDREVCAEQLATGARENFGGEDGGPDEPGFRKSFVGSAFRRRVPTKPHSELNRNVVNATEPPPGDLQLTDFQGTSAEHVFLHSQVMESCNSATPGRITQRLCCSELSMHPPASCRHILGDDEEQAVTHEICFQAPKFGILLCPPQWGVSNYSQRNDASAKSI